ncbi:ABC transporter substrate-binding protein [Pelagibacterium lacus]|uniref:ABC transporter substrate-binding protein n=1 Tax=Pelagibacterium lacus TaxID=2282655 RepID=A0A369W3M6_9HYPH|nr:ABC transporter substrate-binding protein [Pelagibacterium lacus]
MVTRTLGAAIIALMAAGPALAQPEDVLEIKLALGVIDANFNPTNASVFKLAETFGFYEKHGVKVTIIALDGSPQAVAALNSGAVDIADITIDSVVRLRAENDLAIRGIVGVSMGGNFLIAANSEIETIEDLRGKAYAIADNGSLDHALTQVVLRSLGVSDTELNFVAIGAPDVRVQALAAGRVDATTVSFGTYMSVAEVPGLHVLMETDEFSRRGPALSKFVAALESTIETKREALQRFTNALIDTSRAMEADPERWIAAAIEARPDLSPENIQTTSNMIASRWCINGCMPEEGLAASVDFVYGNPDFADVAVIDSADIIDLSFTATAMETLGVAGGSALDAR